MKTTAVSVLVLFALCVSSAVATIGVDLSQLFAVSGFQCLVSNGYSFAIPRCYCSTGRVDSNCVQSVKNAWAGGMKHVDVYMFPCPKCGGATNQVQTLWNHLHGNGVNYGQMWLDVEAANLWTGSVSGNRAFFNELATASQKIFGSKFGGVYTNKNQWSSIMGDWGSSWGSLKLWWAYWDESASWSGWAPFAGWSSPTIKQYAGDKSLCGMSIDKDYYN